MAIELIGTIKPKNGGSFPMVEAADVLMPDGTRLDEAIENAGGGLTEVVWSDITDPPFGEETATLFDGVFQDSLNADGTAWNNQMIIEDTSDAALEIGKTYTVTWDGAEYVCECFAFESFGGLPAVGNTVFVTGTFDNIPFIIGRDAAGVLGMGCVWAASLIETPADLTINGTYTCKIFGEKVEQLDNKYLAILESSEPSGYKIKSEYLPESNSGGSGLPEVTTEDNGKILQVVDGAWQVVALADSAVKTYIDDYINEALGGEY